ncbi:serine aminopeptidase domain-containing protein [Pseudomonas tohonis]|uniref:serine aminopeptidase domain-containing protein n=1 Tax=Pseudomonas tohonis TaxID=2725477 RepID=UPI001F4653D7|nr:alpha/beta hydrolase [Pseudomonas tohonis]
MLLPGMDGSGKLFAPLIHALGNDLHTQVVRYLPEQPLGYAPLMEQVRQQLPVGRPFILLGESFSGPIAVSLAAERPAGLLGLVLCCTFVRNPRPGLAWLSGLLPLVSPRLAPRALLSRLLLGRFATPALDQALADALAPLPSETLQARLRAVLDVDAAGQLQRIQVPLLYLQAAEDRLVPADAVRLIEGYPGDFRCLRLEAPHGLLQARPHEAAQALEGFAKTVEIDPGDQVAGRSTSSRGCSE